MDEPVRDLILEVTEEALDAQLRAVRRLRGEQAKASRKPKASMSQVDMAYDILKDADGPLHVSVIITRILERFAVTVDRESLVSSLSKKVARRDRFVRTARNTFDLVRE